MTLVRETRPARLALALVLAAGGVATATASQAQTDAKGATRGSGAPASPPWQDAADAARKVGDTLPNAFGGVVVNHADKVAEIYLVRGAGPLGDQISRAAGKYARVHMVERSLSALIGTRDRIRQDMEWFVSVGLDASSYGPATQTNSVVVNVPDFTPAQAQAVRDRFGSFVALQKNPEHWTFGAGRWSDSQPWYGGDTITRFPPFGSRTVPTCTLGPILRNPYSGNVYAVTAGHCGLKGANWYNNIPNQYGTQRFVGQAVDVNVADGGTDSAIIYSNAAGLQWANGNTANVQRGAVVTGDMDPDICVTGSLSVEARMRGDRGGRGGHATVHPRGKHGRTSVWRVHFSARRGSHGR